ncbi:MAG: hypothetical protein VB118_10910 [Oscillospiraceae bacterium]|nr:hypothetical protein [Oscillospiraceae bacterium]
MDMRKNANLIDEYDKTCRMCEYSSPLSDGMQLCDYHGVVSPYYKCARFYFDLTKIEISPKRLAQSESE